MIDESETAVSNESVSVIIPAHDAAHTILAQLEAIAMNSIELPWEVVVVLNRCSDGTDKVVRSFAAANPTCGIRVVHADERPGASFARNVGVQHARGSLLLFCDADDIVGDCWAQALADALGGADVVGGRLEAFVEGDSEILDLFPVYRSKQREGLASWNGLLYPLTASMGCRRSVFDRIGGFDERFLHGGDDVAFSRRAQLAGARLAFSPDATCAYRIRPNLERLKHQRQSYARENVLTERLVTPALARPLSYEIGLLLALVVGSLSPDRRRRATRRVHIASQAARVSAAWRLRSAVPDDPSRAHDRPGLFAYLSLRFPKVLSLPVIGAPARRWDLNQPPLDVTVPTAHPGCGGLGITAPFHVARAIASGHYQESDLAAVVEQHGRAKRVVIVGARAGLAATTLARSMATESSMLVLEPVPAFAASLERTLQRHARCRVEVSCALVGGAGESRRVRPSVDVQRFPCIEVTAVGPTVVACRPLRGLDENPIDVLVISDISQWQAIASAAPGVFADTATVILDPGSTHGPARVTTTEVEQWMRSQLGPAAELRVTERGSDRIVSITVEVPTDQ